MTLCSNSSAGRPTSGFWASRPCKRCHWFPAPILLWSASLGAYGGRIWITYAIGMPGTWNESWSCSGATLMRPARTKVWAEIPRRRKPGVQRRRWPDLRITAGKAIVTVWFTCQLLPDQQFAMYTRAGASGLFEVIGLGVYTLERFARAARVAGKDLRRCQLLCRLVAFSIL